MPTHVRHEFAVLVDFTLALHIWKLESHPGIVGRAEARAASDGGGLWVVGYCLRGDEAWHYRDYKRRSEMYNRYVIKVVRWKR